ncbi:MAG: alanine racemase, partial [Clostridia bacterium]|nr:alanine racemase [Clostridia bacterium]
SGLAPALLPQILEAAAELPSIRVRGLMAIPPICTKVGKNRPYFAQMQELFIDIRSKKYDNISMDFLSMGMSGDFEDAVREGANMVRVGSAIFGARHYGL